MQSRLHNWWLHKKTQAKYALTGRTRRAPAFDDVDDSQRHVLTPTPSAQDLQSQHAVADSIFFQRLPAELRRMILIEAFGGRTIHVELEWDREWRWLAIVCHRDASRVARSDHTKRLISEPWMDTCLEYGSSGCRNFSGESRLNCKIGCIGWLTACRQAYIEGVDILYSTNTFHMALRRVENHAFKKDIPRLPRPAHLAMITSLELVLKIEPQDTTDPISKDFYRILRTYDPSFPTLVPSLGQHAFRALLQVLPCAFPNLSYLDLSIRSIWYSVPGGKSDDHVASSEILIIRPFDDLVSKLASRITEFNIAVPTSIYSSRFEADVRASRKFEPSLGGWSTERVWRNIPGQEEGGQVGYWIKKGPDDQRYPFAHMDPNGI